MQPYRLIAALLAVLTTGTALAERPDKGRHFEALDTDGDGRLSAEELNQIPGYGRASAEERFARLDADNSGFVTRQEMHQARERRREQRPKFSELDTDGDRQLSASELDAIPTRRDRSPEERFARLDRNSDGYVSQDELRAGRPGGRPHREH